MVETDSVGVYEGLFAVRCASTANARAGMVLQAAVYDVKGVPVIEMGEALTEAKLLGRQQRKIIVEVDG